MTTLQKLELARDACGSAIPFEDRANYVNLVGLRGILAERERSALTALGQHPGPAILDIPNTVSHSYRTALACMEQVLALRAAVDLLESRPEVMASLAKVEPLVAEVRRLEAELERENAEHGERLRVLREAEEIAKAAALAQAEQDPAVVAAREALEAITKSEAQPEPIKLVRGRQKLAPDELETAMELV